MPKSLGGLGMRDLSLLNTALLTKNLWKIADNNPALWIELVRAKYLPQSGLWQSNRVYLCTRFWKAVMEAREFMTSHIHCLVGNG